jgi:hypothetical protein
VPSFKLLRVLLAPGPRPLLWPCLLLLLLLLLLLRGAAGGALLAAVPQVQVLQVLHHLGQHIVAALQDLQHLQVASQRSSAWYWQTAPSQGR